MNITLSSVFSASVLAISAAVAPAVQAESTPIPVPVEDGKSTKFEYERIKIVERAGEELSQEIEGDTVKREVEPYVPFGASGSENRVVPEPAPPLRSAPAKEVRIGVKQRLNLEGRRIVNLGAPHDPHDAVSKSYLEEILDQKGLTGGVDNLGDHIARDVLNMNGLNITNLKDPVFEEDAANRKFVEDAIREAMVLTEAKINGKLGEDAFNQMLGDLEDRLKEQFKTAEYPKTVELNKGEIGFAKIQTLNVEKALNLGGARLTGVPDAQVDGDAVSLSVAKDLLKDERAALLKEVAAAEKRITESARSWAQDQMTGVSEDLGEVEDQIEARLSEIDGILTDLQRAIALQVSEAPIGASALAEAITLDPAVAKLDRALNINGRIEGFSAQYRSTSNQIVGNLSGADSINAIRALEPVAYSMPDHDGFLLGVDPSSIPGQFDYIRHPDRMEMVDYTQLIAPLIASIQVLDRRVQRIEDSLR